jgi:hypothetical protein
LCMSKEKPSDLVIWFWMRNWPKSFYHSADDTALAGLAHHQREEPSDVVLG